MKNVSVAEAKELFNAKVKKLVEGLQIEELSKVVIINFIGVFSQVDEKSTREDFFQKIDEVKMVVDVCPDNKVLSQKARIISGLEQIKEEIMEELGSHDAQMAPNDEEMISLLEKVIGLCADNPLAQANPAQEQ